jgi:hypothetical protein
MILRRILWSSMALVATALLIAGCQNGMKCTSCNFAGIANNSSSSIGGGGGPVGTFTISNIPSQVTQLGMSPVVPITVTADSNFSGDVGLNVNAPAIAAVDKGAAISYTITPSTVHLTPGGAATASLKINVSPSAPSFTSQPFSVMGTDITHIGQPVAQSSSSLQVKSIYEIRMMGGPSPEVWSSSKTTSFINHPEGITVNFVNYDPNSTHVVHSAGPIPHGDTANPLAVSVNGQPGGMYSTLVSIQTQTSDTYYCHVHESSAQARTLIFNAPVVAATPAPSGNPNAKFSYIETNILGPKCVSCHGTSGGVTLSNYTSTLNVVTKGNALTSQLYTSVQSGTMPLGGSPLSSAEIKDIMDWINDGAANN